VILKSAVIPISLAESVRRLQKCIRFDPCSGLSVTEHAKPAFMLGCSDQILD